jgi:dienelactone hydrolase
VSKGLKLTSVVNATAEALQLKAGDVIQAINDTPVNSAAAVAIVFSKIKAGQPIKFNILRDSNSVEVKGKAAARPFETSANATFEYDAVAYKGGWLRTIIGKPNKATNARMPAMLFIPGYTCTSIDNLSPTHPYKRFIEAFAQAGFVTFRVEKSGLGDSENTPACESCDLYDEIENFEVALKKLKTLPYVDTTKIIIVGHSMGGIVAPALSARNKVAGVAVYGTSAKSWFEYQLEMYRVQLLLADPDPLEYEKSIVDQYDLNYRFYVKNEPLPLLAKDPKNNSILKTEWQYDSLRNMIYSRNANYWRQIQRLPILEYWKATTAKVLVQYGESDFQAFSRADHEQIVRTVNYYHPQQATLQVFPLTDHYYAKSGTMKEAYDKFSKQQIQTLFNEFNPDVTAKAVAWSLSVIQ